MNEANEERFGLRPGVILAESLIWHLLFVRGISLIIKNFLLKERVQGQVSTQSRKQQVDPRKVPPKTPSQLSRKDELLMPTYITGIFHASFIVVAALVLFQKMNSEGFEGRDMFYGYLDLSIYIAEVFMAYIFQDLLFLLYYNKEVKDPEAILHHTVYLVIALYTVSNSYMIFPFTWLCFGEASTPFVSIRWILAVLDMKATSLYFYNGLALLFTFFIARIVVFAYGLYILLVNTEFWLYPHGPFGLNLVVLSLFALYGLNLMWFVRICKGAIKAIKGMKKA